jgi:multiple sugar transport system permease protein
MWDRFRHVTIPNIRTTAIFALLMQTIESVKVFDILYKMTAGGPYETTKVLYFYVYEQGFEVFYLGYASVLAFLVLAVIAFLTLTLLRLSKPSIE